MATTESRYAFSVQLTLLELGKESEAPMMNSTLTYNGLKYEDVVKLEALIPGMVKQMNVLGQSKAEEIKAKAGGDGVPSSGDGVGCGCLPRCSGTPSCDRSDAGKDVV